VAEAIRIPSISVIIPAFNEANYITETLNRLAAAEQRFKSVADSVVQILVVDNASTDRTAEIARQAGATIIYESEHNIARVRNAGAAKALHDFLVFLDADTLVPPELLIEIARTMTNPICIGGAVDCLHQTNRIVIRAYLRFWRILGLILGAAQGACQFCRASVFRELGGYDETWYLGEDVDFYWRMKRLARQRDMLTLLIRDLQVVPSPRRWDLWPHWRILIQTSPLYNFVLRRHKAAWGGWYKEPPR